MVAPRLCRRHRQATASQIQVSVAVVMLSGQRAQIKMEQKASVGSLKHKVEKLWGVKSAQQRMLQGHRELSDGECLGQLRGGSGDTLELTVCISSVQHRDSLRLSRYRAIRRRPSLEV